MATIPMGMSCVGNLYGPNNSPAWHGIEVASSSWLAGVPLINSSGKLAIAADEPISSTVIGVSTAKATGVTDADVLFTPTLNGLIWEITLDTSSSTAVTGTGTVAQTDMWGRFALTLDTGSNYFYLDQSETDTMGLLLIGVKTGVVFGTTKQPRVYVTFPTYGLAAGSLGISIW